MSQKQLAVLGAGSWGTAVALHLARLGACVRLWGRDRLQMEAMQAQGENRRYLPGQSFPENLQAEVDLKAVLQTVEACVIAVPSQGFRPLLTQLKSLFRSECPILWLTKGLDPQQHEFLHEVARAILGEAFPLAILSGPTFATEVAAGLPTAVTLAASEAKTAAYWLNCLHSAYFRVYESHDLVGIQLGGAVKDVLAIAVGLAEGLGCGANAQAALITRGLTELRRLGVAVGAEAETLMGLSGVGDLILTCTSMQSRNRRFGVALGQGETQEAALQKIAQVVEGRATAAEIYALAQKFKVEMPISTQVYQVLYENLAPKQALENLLQRAPRREELNER